MQWTVRAARLDDAPEIARINVDAWRHSYRGIVADPVLDRMLPESKLPTWTRILRLPEPSRVFVAVEPDTGRIGAYCAVDEVRATTDAHPDLHTGQLVAIYGDPRYHGTGAGHQVHEAGLRHLLDQGFRYAVLWALQDHARSRAFCESHGWRHDGRVHQGDQRLPEVRYGRFLPVPRKQRQVSSV